MKLLSLRSANRESTGKSSARSLRKSNLIPTVLYGSNIASVKLTVGSIEFQKILKANKTDKFLLDLIVDGNVKKVTIKELQRHPVSNRILHIDFYEVSMDRKIRVDVPISTVGICKGVELGGILQLVRREVEILCLPDSIPESVDVEISDLNIGDSFHALDLSLPKNVELYGEGDFTILTVLSQKSTPEENESLGEAGEINSDEGNFSGDGAT